jgi:adenine-specific DNA-methyltransferase
MTWCQSICDQDNLQALPASQRTLMTLVLRKLLASSTFAIAGALDSIVMRLKAKLKNAEIKVPVEDELADDFETLDEIKDEWEEDEYEGRL